MPGDRDDVRRELRRAAARRPSRSRPGRRGASPCRSPRSRATSCIPFRPVSVTKPVDEDPLPLAELELLDAGSEVPPPDVCVPTVPSTVATVPAIGARSVVSSSALLALVTPTCALTTACAGGRKRCSGRRRLLRRNRGERRLEPELARGDRLLVPRRGRRHAHPCAVERLPVRGDLRLVGDDRLRVVLERGQGGLVVRDLRVVLGDRKAVVLKRHRRAR